MLYVENTLNPSYFPGLLEKDLTGSLTDLYQRDYGLHYGGVRFRVFPGPLPAFAAGRLHVSPAAQDCLLTEQTATSMGVLLTATTNTGAMMRCVLMWLLGRVQKQTGHRFIVTQHQSDNGKHEDGVGRATRARYRARTRYSFPSFIRRASSTRRNCNSRNSNVTSRLTGGNRHLLHY
ncbi:UTRA domain-containing protein [Mangrovibacter sp. SLW1]